MKIKRIFIDKHLSLMPEAEMLVKRTGLEPVPVSHSREVFDYINSGDDPVLLGKQTLYITENQGSIIRKCPGTSHYTCCDYTILHTGTFCTMDCSYCILQAYFHPPVLQYFVGRNKISDELDRVFSMKKVFRIGTGEFTDSLIWESISDLPAFLVEKFSDQSNSILELKTKTVNIGSLKTIIHNNKTVIAWSLNTPRIIGSEERKTSLLEARLNAAAKCESWGYRLAFHFDPVVIYEGCEKEYESVIQNLFARVSAKNILWISIGTFRFIPVLKQIIEQRFSHSKIAYGEFILGLDNKMRYFKPLRIKVYQRIISCIRKFAPDVLLYFCMEDQEVWEKTMGFFPGNDGGLGKLLDRSAVEHCDLDVKNLNSDVENSSLG